jgi:uncharacterized protein (DUF2147 family)
MGTRFLFSFLALVLFTATNLPAGTATPCEQICGKWQSIENNLVVQVYREDTKFKAKIVWFEDGDINKMSSWTDVNNPDPTLRSRKILGMSVLRDLNYNTETKQWEDGMIYDAKHGRDWNASAYIDNSGLLRVKGYWHFKFIGKTLTFKRVS